MSTVRCYKCKGLKQVAAIGGIVKDCWVCDATGKLTAEPVITGTVTPSLDEMQILSEAKLAIAVPTPLNSITVGGEVVGHVEITEAGMAFMDASVDPNSSMYTPISGPEGLAAKLGVAVDLLLAVLDEPRVEAMAWRKKYAGIPGLLDASGMNEMMTKIERGSLRERYAMLQPTAPRKVDLSKAQDSVAEHDIEYLRYKAKEDAKVAEQEKKVSKK